MDNMKNYESLINDMTDLVYQFEVNKIDYLTFVKTLECVVNYENDLIEKLKALKDQRVVNYINDKLSKIDQKKFRRDLND